MAKMKKPAGVNKSGSMPGQKKVKGGKSTSKNPKGNKKSGKY